MEKIYRDADVSLKRLCFAAHGVNLRHHIGCRFGVLGVIDGDGPALLGGEQGAGRAYAAAAAGDQNQGVGGRWVHVGSDRCQGGAK